MATRDLETRLGRIEAGVLHRAHVPIIRYRDRADIPALLAAVPPTPWGCLVLPMPLDLDDWIMAMQRWRNDAPT